MTFGRPDRIPFEPGGPRESTLARWRREGLPEGVDWRDYLHEQLGFERPKCNTWVSLDVNFRMIPHFAEKLIERTPQGHQIVQDWKGNVCEISGDFDVSYLRHAKDFCTRRWIRCPVTGRDDWARMKQRYDPTAPGRFPDDFEARCKQAADRDYVLMIGFPGPFWQIREWCGFEGLCMMMLDDPDLVDDMAAFWTDFVAGMLDRILKHVVPDRVLICEDMAYKQKAMISPAMTRRFCKPSWDHWCRQLTRANCPVIDMDSDGYIGELIPLWIESGITCCDPIEVAAGNDINAYRRQYGHKMAYHMGVDKRAIAAGGKTIRHELARIEPVLRDGGFFPCCDHGVPSDVSWPAFLDYARLLAQMTGWL